MKVHVAGNLIIYSSRISGSVISCHSSTLYSDEDHLMSPLSCILRVAGETWTLGHLRLLTRSTNKSGSQNVSMSSFSFSDTNVWSKAHHHDACTITYVHDWLLSRRFGRTLGSIHSMRTELSSVSRSVFSSTSRILRTLRDTFTLTIENDSTLMPVRCFSQNRLQMYLQRRRV